MKFQEPGDRTIPGTEGPAWEHSAPDNEEWLSQQDFSDFLPGRRDDEDEEDYYDEGGN